MTLDYFFSDDEVVEPADSSCGVSIPEFSVTDMDGWEDEFIPDPAWDTLQVPDPEELVLPIRWNCHGPVVDIGKRLD